MPTCRFFGLSISKWRASPKKNGVAAVILRCGARFAFHSSECAATRRNRPGALAALTREIIQSIAIEENGFGLEPELTAKAAKLGCRIYEVGISHHGRTYEEGKKIKWTDGIRAVYCIVKYNLFR